MTGPMTGPKAAPTDGTLADGGAGLMARLEALARFSDDPPALTRLYLAPAYRAAALQVQAWMGEAGMEARIDAVGNVVGRYEGIRPGLPALLVGSHIDTVRDAGRYDGNLGVLAAIEAVAALHAVGERLPFAVEVIAFGDEEGARFPVALTGSRAVAGILDAAALDAEDGDGVSVREALRRFGGDPDAIGGVARSRNEALAYVELHIEQGPVLEAEGLPVGVVTAIAGASRFTVEVTGEAGHAGTVPMRLRRDALAAAAEMILEVERIAVATPDLVATVGRIEALPGAVNVIPSRVRFTIDIRSADDGVRGDAIAALGQGLADLARRRGVAVRLDRTYDEAAAVCAPWLVGQLEAAVGRSGIRALRLPSGAGHDGLAMARLCPIGMLFVRCKGGISHNPAESITPEDAGVAVRVLLDLLRHLEPAS
jgi:allantoate deiminase